MTDKTKTMAGSDACALTSAQNIVDCCMFLTQKYEWLLGSSNVDFFVNSVWEKLPTSWQAALSTIEPAEFSELLDRSSRQESGSEMRHRTLWPLSLLALKAAATHLSVPREPSQICGRWRDICLEQVPGACGERATDSGHRRKRARVELQPVTREESQPQTTPCLEHPRLKQLFHKHVKPKKRHEISRLAQAAAAAAGPCPRVVDVGSGVGHLSRMLAYGFGLHVCGVEKGEELAARARRLDVELELAAAKTLTPLQLRRLRRPRHLNLSLGGDATSAAGVMAAFEADPNGPSFNIVGLHTCGDLAATLLRTFAGNGEVASLLLVGCCYMKLTRSPAPCPGFPLSRHLLLGADSRHRHLDYEAMALGCHANESHRQLLHAGLTGLKVHCYRATLEDIIARRWPHLRHGNIASVKCSSATTFSSYCQSALGRLGLRLSAEDLSSTATLEKLASWKRVVNVISIRLLLAPLVETVVLLDRLLFLREAGHSSWLSPLFDPILSPRNNLLIATNK